MARQSGNFDSNTIKSLKELLPTDDEKMGLLAYMKRAGNAEESKEKAFGDFSECEKYMYTMLDVPNAAAKFDCMLFRSQFRGRCDELLVSIEKVENACTEIRNSEKLRIIMAMILTLVNQINTGGDGNGAAGFTLDALLKLNEVRNVVGSRQTLTNTIPELGSRPKLSIRRRVCFTTLQSW